jgi:putative SOS response-associated peptidase YedK
VCGRYAAAKDPTALAEEVDAPVPTESLSADYNVAPTKKVYVVVDRPDEGRAIEVARWGLIPSWAKDPAIGSRMINARVETVDAKPAFRSAFGKRRCLVPATGYYEWYTRPTAPRVPRASRSSSRSSSIRPTDRHWPWRDCTSGGATPPGTWMTRHCGG